MIKKNDNIVARQIHGTFFLIDISDNYSNNKCALYEINETGMFIWNNINGLHKLDDIATLLKNAILDDVDYRVISDDVADFINALVIKHFVEVLCYG